MRTVELIIKESIENTIRNLLPIKDILKNHLDAYDKSNYEAQKKLASNDLRQMLIDEIKIRSEIQSSLNQNIMFKKMMLKKNNTVESDEEEKNIDNEIITEEE